MDLFILVKEMGFFHLMIFSLNQMYRSRKLDEKDGGDFLGFIR